MLYNIYWVKFSNNDLPFKYEFKTFEEFWHYIREQIMRSNVGYLEWIIRD